MTSSPITGYAVVLSYADRSGLLGGFGPYDSEEAAKAGIVALKQMPMAEGTYEVLPLYGKPGAVEKKPVMRGGGSPMCGARGFGGDVPGCIRERGHEGGHGYTDGSGELP